MATLIDSTEDDVPPESRLRLTIHVEYTNTHLAIATELDSFLAIGLFIGDQPLFTPAAYEISAGPAIKSRGPGYFYGEDDGCKLLQGLWQTLQTGERIDINDLLHPAVRIIIGPDILRQKVNSVAKYFDVLIIVQHGGAWHGVAMGGSGPAMMLNVNRQDLEIFFYELLNATLDERISDEESRELLRVMFCEALQIQKDRLQAQK